MDRSFLAFRQFLLRLLSGNDDARPAAQPVRRAPREQKADAGEDWVRIEL